MNQVYSVDIDQCAHCGLVLGEDQFLLAYCGTCGFDYCSEHVNAGEHDCATVCEETAIIEEAELALLE